MADEKSQFLSFLSNLASATGDLSSMTCPAFLLNGYSLLEYSQHWGDHPDLLYDIANPKHNKQERALACLKWFVSTLYGSYRSRCIDSSERKPFNPVLGESFKATWKDENGKGWEEASLVVEQVSHHPPVSAFSVQVPTKKVEGKPWVKLEGHCGQRTTFNTTQILVKQVGRVKVTVNNGESEVVYTIFPLPELAVAGLVAMSIFVDLIGKTNIYGSDGTLGQIEYIPVGWFVGDYFTIKGFVHEDGSSTSSTPYCTISGKWTETSMVTIDGQSDTLFDAQFEPPHALLTPDLSEQLDTESLKLWKTVKDHLVEADYGKASEHKTTIEETQRAIRKERAETGNSFVPAHFQFVAVKEGDEDSRGATKRDPQHTGGIATTELGHWQFKI